MGRAFAEAGMRVMLADIEPKPLQQALEALQGIYLKCAACCAMCATTTPSSARRT
jgi:hypothetical protein